MSGYLETKNLSVGYHGKPLIEDVSLCVQRGKICLLYTSPSPRDS